MFNGRLDPKTPLEVVFPKDDGEGAKGSHYKHQEHLIQLSEFPETKGTHTINTLAHELVHAFTGLLDFPTTETHLLENIPGYPKASKFSKFFPGSTELVNHKISQELNKSGIGEVYELLPYSAKKRHYFPPSP